MKPKGETKLEGVRMTMGTLDCPICYEPLGPPIYQCGVGHLVCNSCCIRLNKCPLCPRSAFERCYGMERVVESIEVPCRFTEYGCTEKIAYSDKKWHENMCWHGGFCPEPGCSFTGPVAALQDHFTGHHKWPFTAFEYYVQFDLHLQPGPHVLRAQDGNVFLMNVVAAEHVGHAISLVCVRSPVSTFGYSRLGGVGCSLVFSCFTGHHQISRLNEVSCSTLADGMPKDVFCVVPKASGGAHVVLKTTIDRVWVYDIELGDENDEDEDKNYDEDDDDCDDQVKEYKSFNFPLFISQK